MKFCLITLSLVIVMALLGACAAAEKGIIYAEEHNQLGRRVCNASLPAVSAGEAENTACPTDDSKLTEGKIQNEQTSTENQEEAL